MIRWGVTRQHKQRFRCATCKTTGIKTRSDTTQRNIKVLFERWLLNTETLDRIAKHRGTQASALIRLFEPFWNEEIQPEPYRGTGYCVVVDGVFVGRGHAILFALDAQGIPITWYACTRENTATWEILFAQVRACGVAEPALIVSDGQKGLLRARKSIFPFVPHQRCMTHVVRLAHAWLTRFPQTVAGKELRTIVSALYSVSTQEQADEWSVAFKQWCTMHHAFLKEKSISVETGRTWYTHRKLRAVRSLILGAYTELFTFIKVPNTPKTTNHVEGGVNSPLKALLRHHRGMPPHHREVLVFRFLRARSRRKYQH